MNDAKLVVLDLFMGTGSATQAFRERGHRVIGLEKYPENTHYRPLIQTDIVGISWTQTLQRFDLQPGDIDIIWASPPCQGFSVASMGRMWDNTHGYLVPKHKTSVRGLAILEATWAAIQAIKPRYYWIENPRGAMRKMDCMIQTNRDTVTYCQYGETRMKPTDLWGQWPDTWQPQPPCKNGDPCHESAPRGAKTGTQGIKGARDRSKVPYALSLEICLAVEKAYGIK